MKPIVIAIAGSALMFLCLGNPKQQKKQQLSSKRSAVVASLKTTVRK